MLARSRRRATALLVSAAMVGSAFLLTAAAQPSDDNGWQLGQPRLTTPWTDQVSPSNALPEYPRPQLARARWQNLNGVWQFAGAGGVVGFAHGRSQVVTTARVLADQGSGTGRVTGRSARPCPAALPAGRTR